MLWKAQSVRMHFLAITADFCSFPWNKALICWLIAAAIQSSNWLWLGFNVQISFWFPPPPYVCLDQTSVRINHSIKRVANMDPAHLKHGHVLTPCPCAQSLSEAHLSALFVVLGMPACPYHPTVVFPLSPLCPFAVWLAFLKDSYTSG